MVRTCSAFRCNNQFIKGGQVAYHMFPSDPEKRNLWIKALKDARKTAWNFVPGKYSYVCSNHFTEDCFITTGIAGPRKKKALTPDAVPTIFYSNPPATVRKQLDSNEEEPSTSSYNRQQEPGTSIKNTSEEKSSSLIEIEQITEGKQQNDESTITAETNNPIGTSFNSVSTPSPRKSPVNAKKYRPCNFRYVDDCTSSDMSSPNKARIAKQQVQKKLIQHLNVVNRRLKAKVKNLNSLLNSLEEKNLMSSENAEINMMVEEDLENYVKFKITGKYKRMKPEIVPHRNIFHRPTSNNCVVSSLDKCASTTTSTTVKLEEETNTKMSPLICIIQPVPSLDNTQPLTSPAKKKLRLILPKNNTGNTSSDADIETTLLPSSSTDSTTEAQCSKDNTDSSPNIQMNLETDVHHFEEIYIKEEPLEENTSDYEYDNFLQDIKEESDNVNEIDIKEENEIM